MTQDPKTKSAIQTKGVVRLIKDLPSSAASTPEVEPEAPPLTAKLLEDYVSRLVDFEQNALVGQEAPLQPAQLTELSQLRRPPGKGFKIKKKES